MREPGFMDLAKKRAKGKQKMMEPKPMSPQEQLLRQQVQAELAASMNQRKGAAMKMDAYSQMQEDRANMINVPMTYDAPDGHTESLAYINPEEAEMLQKEGGAGEMTPYGVRSFSPEATYAKKPKKKTKKKGGKKQRQAEGTAREKRIKATVEKSHQDSIDQQKKNDPKSKTSRGGGGSSPEMTEEQAKEKYGLTSQEDVDEQVSKAGDKALSEYRESERGKRVGEYEGYKERAGTLEGQTGTAASRLGDLSGKVEGYQSTFDQLGRDAREKGEAGEEYFKGRATAYGDAATAGAGKQRDIAGRVEDYESSAGGIKDQYSDIGDAYKSITGQGIADAASEAQKGITTQTQKMEGLEGDVDIAAKEGQTGYRAGATDVGEIKKQFGKEGFQKESGELQAKMAGLEAGTGAIGQKAAGYEEKLAGLSEKALSGEVGRAQSEQLRGQMEEQRMGAQKGSEEKLRRELAQSGASPSEIAAKVAQFQKQSATDQASAGRSERLSSALQGQQMGQAQLGQAAGLTQSALGALNPQMQAQSQLQQQMQGQAGMLGQKAGMAGQQASLAEQQAAMTGKASALGLQATGQKAGLAGQQMAGAQAAGQFGMQGAEGQQRAQLASLSGQMGAASGESSALGQQMGAAGQAAGLYGKGTGMEMQGIQGAGSMYGQGLSAGMQGIGTQGQMAGQGIGALQGAGAMTGQQIGAYGQQGQFIDQQGGYTQAQLNDLIAQDTMAFNRQNAANISAANAAAQPKGGGGGGGFLDFLSDIRLKDDINLIKEGKDGDPNIYSFKYKWDKDTTWSGVMAQELLNTKHSDAVSKTIDGYYMVNYQKLGFPMVQLST